MWDFLGILHFAPGLALCLAANGIRTVGHRLLNFEEDILLVKPLYIKYHISTKPVYIKEV